MKFTKSQNQIFDKNMKKIDEMIFFIKQSIENNDPEYRSGGFLTYQSFLIFKKLKREFGRMHSGDKLKDFNHPLFKAVSLSLDMKEAEINNGNMIARKMVNDLSEILVQFSFSMVQANKIK